MPNCVDIYNHCRPQPNSVFLPVNKTCVPYFIQDQPTTVVDNDLSGLSNLISDNSLNMCKNPQNTYKTDSREFISSFSYDQEQTRNIHYKIFKDSITKNYCNERTTASVNCLPGKPPPLPMKTPKY